jgi:hypothetical protein
VSKTYIPVALRRLVEERASSRCEFCLLPAELAFLLPHEVDHVIAEKHGGETAEGNLALTCWRCNRHKGTDLASFDPQSGDLTPLFNPRTQRWREHFALSSTALEGLTDVGRTTIRLLQLNAPERLAERQRLLALGRLNLPPLE